jgi:hypothetical protein
LVVPGRRGIVVVPDAEQPSKYALTLEQLESQVRVRFEDQVTEQPGDAGADRETRWDEQRRQLRLAGGA